jgi:hypothetical protein
LWERRWDQKHGLDPSLRKTDGNDKENDIVSSRINDGDVLTCDDEELHDANDGNAITWDDEEPDGVEVDEAEEATAQKGNDDSDEVSQPEHPAETRYAYRDVMSICQNIAPRISKQANAATHVGILLQF